MPLRGRGFGGRGGGGRGRGSRGGARGGGGWRGGRATLHSGYWRGGRGRGYSRPPSFSNASRGARTNGGRGGTGYPKKRVYALTLEDGKKYVGETSNLKRRLDQHVVGRGSRWTQQHRPVKVHKVYNIPRNDPTAERRITESYMDAHGPQNVRGAGYTARRLPRPQYKALQKDFGRGWLYE